MQTSQLSAIGALNSDLVCRVVACWIVVLASADVRAGTVFRSTYAETEHIWRWNADSADTMITEGTTSLERSLSNGLRFSFNAASYGEFRDLFPWKDAAPSVADFTNAVNGAFNTWASVDPVTGLGTQLSFVDDHSNTAVNSGSVGFLALGSEIDVFGVSQLPDATPLGPERGSSAVFALGVTVDLTSGVQDYKSFRISGGDVFISTAAGSDGYTLHEFQNLLTHEIGHTLGFADAERGDVVGDELFGTFLDDNYNANDAANTLTNSWASLVNINDPDNLTGTGLSLYQVKDDAGGNFVGTSAVNGTDGLDAAGVTILMESDPRSPPPTGLVLLSNDDYGTRQFLYPQAIPEPAASCLLLLAAMFFAGRRVSRASSRV